MGRWTSQKDVDIIVRAAEEVLPLHPDTGLCIFGEGNQRFLLENLTGLVEQFPGRLVVIKGFSASLAANIYPAGDFFLVPSRFEPCGLVDMIAQLNGNLPIVNQVGGLAKVVDGVTGIGYFATSDRGNMRGLVRAMRRAIDLHADSLRNRRMQQSANRTVREKYAWNAVFRPCARLYVGNKRNPSVSRDASRCRPA